MAIMNRKTRNYIIYMVTVVVAILVIFNTVLTFKINGYLSDMASKPGRWPVGAYNYSPNIGFDFAPLISDEISDGSFYVKSHRLGYRIGKDANPNTFIPGGILSLGCSMTYGDEVDSEYTFTQQLADSLDIPAYNYGISSFSYIHSLVKAQNLKSDGILDSLNPKIVMLGCWDGLINRSKTPFPPIAARNVPLTAAYIKKESGKLEIEYPTSTKYIFDLAKLYRTEGPGLSVNKFFRIFKAAPVFMYMTVKNSRLVKSARGFASRNKVSNYELYDYYFTEVENLFPNDEITIMALHMPVKFNGVPDKGLLKAIKAHPRIIFVDGNKAIQEQSIPRSEYQGKHPQPKAHMAYTVEALRQLRLRQ